MRPVTARTTTGRPRAPQKGQLAREHGGFGGDGDSDAEDEAEERKKLL